MIKRLLSVFLALVCTTGLYADVRTDAMNCAMAYYSYLKQYAQNPSDLSMEDKIKRLVSDGKGSVYNDIYSKVLKKEDTSSDIGNYLAEIGGYKNRNGYCLHIEVVEESLSFQSRDASSGFITATKRVYCNYGRQKIDYTVREKMLVRSGRIVYIKKADDNASFLSVSPSSIPIDADGGSRTLSVSTDGAWRASVTSGSNWIHVSTSGNQLSLTIDKNTLTSSRTGNVKVNSGIKEQEVIITQSGAVSIKASKSSEIKSVTVSNDATVDGKKGLSVKVSFVVRGMNGKDGTLSCYFYDVEGNALRNNNDYYGTSGTPSNVAASRSFKPRYDSSEYTDYEITIPYDELHLSGTYSRTLRVDVIVWDTSVSPNKKLVRKSNTTFNCVPNVSYLKVDGTTSDKTVSFRASGGRVNFSVDTNSQEFETWGVPDWCRIENKSSSSFTLVCKPNSSSSEQRDYMKVKAGGKEIRIDIKQDGKESVAEVENCWITHNLTKTMWNGFMWINVPYMRIHCRFSVEGHKNETIRICAFFYFSNGNRVNAVNNEFRTSDGQATVQGTGKCVYESSLWEDYTLDIPYYALPKGSLYVEVQIQDNKGAYLAESSQLSFQVL